eukprot:GHVH01006043.1.p1 GENE.GHVH01006043.1~~GHVH01006043.1.p1  ORF type:complete len:217 (-),score=33.58 GHVH01006043.1:318-968(-)
MVEDQEHSEGVSRQHHSSFFTRISSRAEGNRRQSQLVGPLRSPLVFSSVNHQEVAVQPRLFPPSDDSKPNDIDERLDGSRFRDRRKAARVKKLERRESEKESKSKDQYRRQIEWEIKAAQKERAKREKLYKDLDAMRQAQADARAKQEKYKAAVNLRSIRRRMKVERLKESISAIVPMDLKGFTWPSIDNKNLFRERNADLLSVILEEPSSLSSSE